MNTKIRVNTIHRGATNTELGKDAITAAKNLGLLGHVNSTEEVSQLEVTQFPMGHWGEVGDITGAIAFLASDVSSLITGSDSD